jgi:hypothetical protein
MKCLKKIRTKKFSYNGSLKCVCGSAPIPRVSGHTRMFVGAKNVRRKSCIENEEHVMSNTLLPYTVLRRKLNRDLFKLLRASNRVDV